MRTVQWPDFRKEVYAASGLAFHWRYDVNTAQWIDAVDMTKQNRHCFVGDFILSGAVEVPIGRPRLILVESMSGPSRRLTMHYCVVRLEADGTLTATDIRTDDTTSGWALRIRDRVATLLEGLDNPGATARG